MKVDSSITGPINLVDIPVGALVICTTACSAGMHLNNLTFFGMVTLRNTLSGVGFLTDLKSIAVKISVGGYPTLFRQSGITTTKNYLFPITFETAVVTVAQAN